MKNSVKENLFLPPPAPKKEIDHSGNFWEAGHIVHQQVGHMRHGLSSGEPHEDKWFIIEQTGHNTSEIVDFCFSSVKRAFL